MTIFKRIKWKNLLGTGDQFTEIDLNKSPTTLIYGTNGTGKSLLSNTLINVVDLTDNKEFIKYLKNNKL